MGMAAEGFAGGVTGSTESEGVMTSGLGLETPVRSFCANPGVAASIHAAVTQTIPAALAFVTGLTLSTRLAILMAFPLHRNGLGALALAHRTLRTAVHLARASQASG